MTRLRLFVVIPIMLILSFGGGSIYASSLRHVLPSGTILLQTGNELWIIDPPTLAREFYWHLDPPTGWDFALISGISPDGQHVYFRGIDSRWLTASEQIIQVDLASRESKVAFERAGLIGMSPISPDGKRAIVFYDDDPTDPYSNWVFCLLNLETDVCPKIDFPFFDRNDFFWINNLRFATMSSDNVYVYTVCGSELCDVRSTGQSQWQLTTAALIPQTKRLLVAGYNKQTSPPYTPVFLTVDLDSLEISEMSYGVATEYFAAFNRVSVASNQQYMWYGRSDHLDLVSFQTGELIAQSNEVWQVVWTIDGQRIVILSEPRLLGEPFRLKSFDIRTNLFSDPVDLDVDVFDPVVLLVVP